MCVGAGLRCAAAGAAQLGFLGFNSITTSSSSSSSMRPRMEEEEEEEVVMEFTDSEPDE